MKKIFINNLLIILIFFFIFEIFLRTFDLADLRGHGKELMKKQSNVETIVFGKRVFLNQYGYRVPNRQFAYKKGVSKTIFIGDSVLFGSGVREEETFLGKLREDNENKSYVNAAIIGNDISENLSDIKKNHSLFDGRDFIIVLTLDDIDKENITVEDNKDNKINISLIKKLKSNYIFNEINLFLRTKSYTYLWIKGITTNPSKRYFFESLNSYKEKEKINFFIKKMDEMKSLKKSKSINIKFIIIPYEYQTRKQCNLEILLPQKKVVEILKKREIEYINLTRDFCSHKNPKKLYLNFDPVHLSPKGHEFVFKLIKNEIN